MEVSRRLDAHSLPRVHRGREEEGLARAGTVTRKRERSPDGALLINGISIQMNTYSINRPFEPGASERKAPPKRGFGRVD